MYIMSMGSTAASEGIGGVIFSFFAVIGALALIYAVLELMNYYHKKHDPNEKPPEPQNKDFSQVLEEQIELKKSDEDKINRI